MKKHFIFPSLALIILSGCSNNDLPITSTNSDQTVSSNAALPGGINYKPPSDPCYHRPSPPITPYDKKNIEPNSALPPGYKPPSDPCYEPSPTPCIKNNFETNSALPPGYQPKPCK